MYILAVCSDTYLGYCLKMSKPQNQPKLFDDLEGMWLIHPLKMTGCFPIFNNEHTFKKLYLC
jgi:hypothetical protein